MKNGKNKRDAGEFVSGKVLARQRAEKDLALKTKKEEEIRMALEAANSKSSLLRAKEDQKRKQERLVKKRKKEIASDFTRDCILAAALGLAKCNATSKLVSGFGYWAASASFARRELITWSEKEREEINSAARAHAQLVHALFKVESKNDAVVILVPRNKDEGPMLPGQRTPMFHGTSVFAALNVIKEGFVPSVSGLLGPGVYLGEENKARYFKKASSVLIEDNLDPYASSSMEHFNGVMIELEAVLGRVETVTSHYSSYTDPDIQTLHGKAGVTPSGRDYTSFLVQDEWCVLPHNLDPLRRFRIQRISIERGTKPPLFW
jgi:hypothetical protein